MDWAHHQHLLREAATAAVPVPTRGVGRMPRLDAAGRPLAHGWCCMATRPTLDQVLPPWAGQPERAPRCRDPA